MVTNKSWINFDSNVLAMSPNSDFLTYLHDTYGDYTIAFDFKKYSDRKEFLDLIFNFDVENPLEISTHPFLESHQWKVSGHIKDLQNVN